MRLKFSLFSFFILFTTTIKASEISHSFDYLKYIDDKLERIHLTLDQAGTIQLDETAIEAGANEWKIKLELINLEGEDKESLDRSWENFVEKEEKEISQSLRKGYGDQLEIKDDAPLNIVMMAIRDQMEANIFIQKGLDHPEAKSWFLKETLTKAAAAVVDWDFKGAFSDKFEYYRYHWDDTSSEVLGEDYLFIRGSKKVIVIKINYCHC